MNPHYDETAMQISNDQNEDFLTRAEASPEIPALLSNDDAKLPCTENNIPPTRKRLFKRRFGECHITLIKAATLAAMSSPNSHDDDSDTNEFRGDGDPCVTNLLLTAPSMPESYSDRERLSSRKRLRGSNYSAIVDQTSMFLDSLRVTDDRFDKEEIPKLPTRKDDNTGKSTKQPKK